MNIPVDPPRFSRAGGGDIYTNSIEENIFLIVELTLTLPFATVLFIKLYALAQRTKATKREITTCIHKQKAESVDIKQDAKVLSCVGGPSTGPQHTARRKDSAARRKHAAPCRVRSVYSKVYNREAQG